MANNLLECVRRLRLADPELGPKPLLARLREQRPELGAGNKEVREALLALKVEGEGQGGHALRAGCGAAPSPLRREQQPPARGEAPGRERPPAGRVQGGALVSSFWDSARGHSKARVRCGARLARTDCNVFRVSSP